MSRPRTESLPEKTMHTDISLLDLRLRRRLLIGYTLGMALYALVIVSLYPEFKNTTSLNRSHEARIDCCCAFRSHGFAHLSVQAGSVPTCTSNFLPLIMLLITVGYGASCLAGQDEDGTLCIVATLPIARRGILFEKVATLTVQAIVLAFVIMACIIVGRGFDLPSPSPIWLGSASGIALLGVDFGLLAILVGSRTGSRGVALGVTSAIAAASYLFSSLAPVVAWIRPARYASLFYWSVGNSQLTTGLTLGSAGVLALVGAALIGASIWAFNRLDLH